MALEKYGADIINDISGELSPVSNHPSPIIVMSSAATIDEMLIDLAGKVGRLRSKGQKDSIIDPGFGFGKTVEQNYAVLQQIEKLQVLRLPVLVGVSRKSMIWKTLDVTPEEALNGTTALNMVALEKGASILRVHDVKEAVETVKLYINLRNS
jgi:dihydropteroate synthase